MLGAVDTPLTVAGFVALASLGIGAVGLALKAGNQNNDLRERLTRLETQLQDHLRNGGRRHEREE